MGGHIEVTGVATGTGGTNPFIWNDTNNQAITVDDSEGVTAVESTGVFTVDPGYGGTWFFCWNVSVTGTNAATHTFELISDPAGTPSVVLQSRRKLGTGADIGNASLQGVVTAAAGDTFAMRVSGDSGGKVDFGTLCAFQIAPP